MLRDRDPATGSGRPAAFAGGDPLPSADERRATGRGSSVRATSSRGTRGHAASVRATSSRAGTARAAAVETRDPTGRDRSTASAGSTRPAVPIARPAPAASAGRVASRAAAATRPTGRTGRIGRIGRIGPSDTIDQSENMAGGRRPGSAHSDARAMTGRGRVHVGSGTARTARGQTLVHRPRGAGRTNARRSSGLRHSIVPGPAIDPRRPTMSVGRAVRRRASGASDRPSVTHGLPRDRPVGAPGRGAHDERSRSNRARSSWPDAGPSRRRS